MIHIVDQDEAVRESVAALLQSSGFRTRTFPDGEAFLDDEKLAETSMVLLDVTPPLMAGLGTLKEMEARRIDLPVVLMTAVFDSAVRARTRRARAIMTIEKPINEEHLLQAIDLAASEES